MPFKLEKAKQVSAQLSHCIKVMSFISYVHFYDSNAFHPFPKRKAKPEERTNQLPMTWFKSTMLRLTLLVVLGGK